MWSSTLAAKSIVWVWFYTVAVYILTIMHWASEAVLVAVSHVDVFQMACTGGTKQTMWMLPNKPTLMPLVSLENVAQLAYTAGISTPCGCGPIVLH